MDRSTFVYVPTIEQSYAARRYSVAEGSKDQASSITATWLGLIPFNLFACIEPNPSADCKAVVEQFCAVVERFHRCPLSGIIGYELHPMAHAHLVMACPAELDIDWMRRYLGQQKLSSFDLQRFDPALDGLPYALKILNKGGEVDYRNLDLYIKTPANRKDRKRRARHQARLNASRRPV